MAANSAYSFYGIILKLGRHKPGMDPAEKFWGGEVARSAAEGAMAIGRGSGAQPPKIFGVFSRAIDVDGCFH